MSRPYARGWYQVAFERDLTADLTPTCVGARRLILARTEAGFRAFDADCPHRGAHLGFGGRLVDGTVQCPFHGYRIRLGCHSPAELAVAEYPLLLAGGMVFVRLSEGHDHGWPAYVQDLVERHHMISGFEMTVRTRAETVIDNAFDRRHFETVHAVQTEDFEIQSGLDGELIAESTFFIPSARDGRAELTPTPYKAVVISPGVAMVELRGAIPYTVVTGATDDPDNGCVIRLTLALPRSHFPGGPPPAFYESLLKYSRRGLEQDRAVWENLSPSVRPRWTAEDGSSLSFLQFCETFAAP
jgi:nitrite reductase/ring-hydroxylating ferredoxin subunit